MSQRVKVNKFDTRLKTYEHEEKSCQAFVMKAILIEAMMKQKGKGQECTCLFWSNDFMW